MPLIGVGRSRRACTQGENETSEILPEDLREFFHSSLLECMGAATSAEGAMAAQSRAFRPSTICSFLGSCRLQPFLFTCSAICGSIVKLRHACRWSGVFFVQSSKQHRYVSRLGPFLQSRASDSATTRALDVAENDGWPLAKPTAEAAFGLSTAARRPRFGDIPPLMSGGEPAKNGQPARRGQ